MAQHIAVKDEKILKSINRIAPKVFSDIRHKLLMDMVYYKKSIMHLIIWCIKINFR